MPPQFKSMDDLSKYLDELEKRIDTIAPGNEKIETTNIVNYLGELEKRIDFLEQINRIAEKNIQLPKTNLLDKRFLIRSFAVWGHFIIANLIISAVLGAGYMCIFLLLLQKFPPNK